MAAAAARAGAKLRKSVSGASGTGRSDAEDDDDELFVSAKQWAAALQKFPQALNPLMLGKSTLQKATLGAKAWEARHQLLMRMLAREDERRRLEAEAAALNSESTPSNARERAVAAKEAVDAVKPTRPSELHPGPQSALTESWCVRARVCVACMCVACVVAHGCAWFGVFAAGSASCL